MGILDRIKNIFRPTPPSKKDFGDPSKQTPLPPAQSSPAFGSGGKPNFSSGGSGGGGGGRSSARDFGDPSLQTQIPQEDLRQQSIATQQDLQRGESIASQLGSSKLSSSSSRPTSIQATEDLSQPTFEGTSPGVSTFFTGLGTRAKSVARFEEPVGFLFDPLRGRGRPKAFKEVSEEDVMTFERTTPFQSGLIGTTTTIPTTIQGLTYGEQQIFQELQEGIPLGLIGLPSEVKIKRTGERIAREEEERVLREFQPLVTSGELDVATAQGLAEQDFQRGFGERFERESGTLIGSIERSQVKGLGRTRGDIIADVGTLTTELGLTGAAFVSGSPTAITVTSGILSGLGTRDIQRGITGTQLSTKERLTLLGTGTLSAGLGAFGIRSVIGTQPTSILARQSQRELLQELSQQPVSIGGLQLAKGKAGDLFKISSSRVLRSGRAAQEIDILAPTFRSGKTGLPRIVGGKASVRTRVTDVISGQPIFFDEKFTLGTRGTRTGTSLGLTRGGVKQTQNFDTLFGKGFIQRTGQDNFREFNLAGASRRKGDVLEVVDVVPKRGRLTQLQDDSIERVIGGRVVRVPVGEQSFGLNLRGQLGGTGEIKLLPEAEKIRIVGSGSRTPLSRTFQEQTQSQLLGAEVLPGLTRESLQEATTKATQTLTRQTRTIGLGGQDTLNIQQQTRQFQRITPTLSQALSPRQRTRQDPLGLGRTRTTTLTSLTTRQDLGIAQIPRQTTTQTGIFSRPTGTTIVPSSFTPPRPTLRGLPFLPPGLTLRQRPGRSSSLLGKRGFRYSPSLTAITFRLFGRPSKRALETGEVTPFETRFLVNGKSQKNIFQSNKLIPQRRRKKQRKQARKVLGLNKKKRRKRPSIF